MSDAPARIWAELAGDEWGVWGAWGTDQRPGDTPYVRADLAEEMAKALAYYASAEAWTVNQVEAPDGDYGKKATAALTRYREATS